MAAGVEKPARVLRLYIDLNAAGLGPCIVTTRPSGAPDTAVLQLSPTISPFSSMSMISAAGCVDSPGIVLISPQMR